MIAPQVIRHVLQRLEAEQPHHLPPALGIVLSRADAAILQLVYDLALHTGLPHAAAIERSGIIALQHCAIHLADDLADGDCDYLETPIAQGATALHSLQHAFALGLQNLYTEHAHSFANVHRNLLEVGFSQHREIATRCWTLPLSKEMAIGLNGKQFAAYFSLCTFAHAHHDSWHETGMAFGICNHVANDIRSRDARFFSLDATDQQALRAWARTYLNTLRISPLPGLQHQARHFARYLQ